MYYQKIDSAFSPGKPVDPSTVKPEIILIRDLANDFGWLSSLLYSIGSGWIHMDRSMKHEYYDVTFASGNDELQLQLRPHRCEELWQLELAELEQSTMRQFDQILKRDLKELYEIHAKTDWRLFQLNPEIVDALSVLTKVPWVQYVQRKCLLTILRWPKRIPSRERWGFGSMSDPKPYIPTEVGTLIKYASEADPIPHWQAMCETLEEFKLDLIAISSLFGRMEPEGAIALGKWRHQGKVFDGPSQPLTQRFALELWNAKHYTLSFSSLAESVWLDDKLDLTAHQVGGQRKKLNDFFRLHGIPWHVEVLGSPGLAALKQGPPPPK